MNVSMAMQISKGFENSIQQSRDNGLLKTIRVGRFHDVKTRSRGHVRRDDPEATAGSERAVSLEQIRMVKQDHGLHFSPNSVLWMQSENCNLQQNWGKCAR